MQQSERGVAILRPKRTARARFSRVASARDTIDGFGHDVDISFALTMGQFSLLDLIEATLDLTGPADVLISTWSAGFYDVDAAQRFAQDGRMRSCRFIMDSSAKRGQATGADVADIFGDDAIRTTRTHAKFVVITNDDWNVVIQSSMNLNLNPRSEQFSMSDDPDTATFILTMASELWAELPPGATEDRTTPTLRSLTAVQPRLGVHVASSVAMGAARAGKVHLDAR